MRCLVLQWRVPSAASLGYSSYPEYHCPWQWASLIPETCLCSPIRSLCSCEFSLAKAPWDPASPGISLYGAGTKKMLKWMICHPSSWHQLCFLLRSLHLILSGQHFGDDALSLNFARCFHRKHFKVRFQRIRNKDDDLPIWTKTYIDIFYSFCAISDCDGYFLKLWLKIS